MKVYRSGVKMTEMRSKMGVNLSLYRWRLCLLQSESNMNLNDHTAEIVQLICPLMKKDASFPQETTRPSETFKCNKVLTSPRVLLVAHFSRLERRFIGMRRKYAQ